MIFYIISLLLLFIFCIFLVCYFSHQKVPFYVRIIVILSFLFSFISFIVLPADIYETAQKSSLSSSAKTVWAIIYNVNFFLCWLILPFVQQFEDSGSFTVKQKIKDALKINAIIFGILGAGGLLLMIYLMLTGKFTASQLPGLIPTIVNIFGLTLVSILLGFGLISFPKECWRNIYWKKRVKKCHILAEKISSQQQQVKQLVFEIKKILERRQYNNDSISDGNQAKILQKIHQKFNFENFRSYADEDYKLHKYSNSDLNTLVNKKIVQYNACENDLQELVQQLKAVTVEYSKNNYFYSKIVFSFLFVVTTLVSILIFWAQLSTFIHIFNKINIFNLINLSPTAAYFLNLCTLLYIAYIVAHTVFRIKVFHKFSLHKSNSSSASLCFTSINLARVSFPLCYNYEQITSMPESSFLKFFGVINIDEKYGFIFPIIMIVFALFNIFDVYDKIVGYLGYESYAFDQEQQEQKTDEGRTILTQKFKKMNTQSHRMQMIQFL